MKVGQVNNHYGYVKDRPSHLQKREGAPAFKSATLVGGISDGVVSFFNAMERGGFAASFIFADTLSTNIPRTLQATERGMDITGKRNYKAAGEVVIREFVTGPSMFAVPAIVLAAAAKLTGTANNVSIESIQGFSDILRNTSTKGNLKQNFYREAFKKIAETTFGQNAEPIDVEKYVKILMHSEGVDIKRNFIQKLLDKTPAKGRAVDQIVSDLVEQFSKDKKARVNYRADFTTAKVSKLGSEMSFRKVVKDMQNYINDASKYIEKNGNPKDLYHIADKFGNIRAASRFITTPLALIATAAFLSIIPKLYSFNKKNPETEALYDKIGQERKVATNAANK